MLQKLCQCGFEQMCGPGLIVMYMPWQVNVRMYVWLNVCLHRRPLPHMHTGRATMAAGTLVCANLLTPAGQECIMPCVYCTKLSRLNVLCQGGCGECLVMRQSWCMCHGRCAVMAASTADTRRCVNCLWSSEDLLCRGCCSCHRSLHRDRVIGFLGRGVQSAACAEPHVQSRM